MRLEHSGADTGRSELPPGDALRQSGRTGQLARSVGQGRWVVRFLPGRTLSQEQAQAAMRVAGALDTLREDAAVLGLTVLELVGLATMENLPSRLWSFGEKTVPAADSGQTAVRRKVS